MPLHPPLEILKKGLAALKWEAILCNNPYFLGPPRAMGYNRVECSSESCPWNILGSDGSIEIELELEYMSYNGGLSETDLLREPE
jgi:hypothetical protein